MSVTPVFTDTTVPVVSLVIVTYKDHKHLDRCLESVFRLDYPSDQLEVLVVDNGSAGDAFKRTRERYPKIIWLKNDVNNYCRANNLALSHAKGTVVGFVNNDVRLDRRWLRELVPNFFSDEQVGAVGGKVLLKKGVLNSTGQVELPHGAWTDRGHREPDVGQFDQAGPVNGLSGSAVLYRRDCLDDVGPFDEDFHMYYEDIDLAHRSRERGWKLLYVPSATALHAFHGTASEEFVEKQTTRNRLLFLAKYWPQRLAASLSVSEGNALISGRVSQGILENLPALSNKLVKHHGVDGLMRWLPDILSEAGKVIRKERQFLSNRLKDEQQAVKSLIADAKRSRKEAEQLGAKTRSAQVENARAVAQAEERHIEREKLWSKIGQGEEKFWEKIRELEQKLQDGQRAAIDREKLLGKLEQEVVLKESWLKHHREMIGEKQKTLDQLYRQVDEWKRNSERLKETNRTIQRTLDSRSLERDNLGRVLTEKEQTFNQKLRETEARAQEHLTALQNLQKSLFEKDQWLERHSKTIAEQNKMIHKLEKTSEEQKNTHRRGLEDFRKTISEKNHALNRLEKEHVSSSQALKQYKQMVLEKDKIILERTGDFERERKTLHERDRMVLDRDRVLAEKSRMLVRMETAYAQAEKALQARSLDVKQAESLHSRTRAELDALYGSTAHRFLVRPLWAILMILRRPLPAAFSWEQRRILVVKPFYVPAVDAIHAMQKLKIQHPQARFTFLANVFSQERKALETMKDVEARWLFDPWSHRLTGWRLIGLVIRASLRFYAEGIVLVGPFIPGTYRKSTLLLSGVTPSVRYYHVDTDKLVTQAPDPLVKRDLGRSNWNRLRALAYLVPIFWKGLVFVALAVGFAVLVWWPVQLRRFLHRP